MWQQLIDSKAIAGQKAFRWETAFAKIFTKGGFDVVIGNPPYVRVQNLESKLVDYYFESYESPKGKLDLSIFFLEKNAHFTKFMLYVFTAMQLVTYFEKSILCGKINSLLKTFNLYLW